MYKRYSVIKFGTLRSEQLIEYQGNQIIYLQLFVGVLAILFLFIYRKWKLGIEMTKKNFLNDIDKLFLNELNSYIKLHAYFFIFIYI